RAADDRASRAVYLHVVPAADPMTSVLIVDDQALVRVGLRKILEAEPETSVVGDAGDGEEAVTEARRLRPGVVLMDIRSPVLAPAVSRTVLEECARQRPAVAPTPPPAVAELTPREHEVFDLLARGLSNPEICEQLVISEATAKTHVARILQKLDLRDRVQAVIYAYETGLVAPGSATEPAAEL